MGIIVTSHNFGAPSVDPLLLDLYPMNATGGECAVGLIKLRTGYNGPCIRVARGLADEQDIGFTAGNPPELDTVALEAFAAGGPAWVMVFYDQSGKGYNCNAYDFLTAPKIVDDAGDTILYGGRPAVQFTTTTTKASELALRTQAYNPTASQPNTFFICGHSLLPLSSDRSCMIDSRTDSTQQAFFFFEPETDDQLGMHSGLTIYQSVGYAPGNLMATALFSNPNSQASYNNTVFAFGETGNNSLDGLTLGHLRNRVSLIYSFMGALQVALHYNSDQFINRFAIETILNNYYNKY